MFIDYSYFIGGKLSLPDIDNTSGRNIIQNFIDIYEPEFLKKALCLDLWKAYTDGIEGSGEPEQKWQDLTKGKLFLLNSRYVEWNGFKPDEGKKSPIANYVWYKYMEDKYKTNSLVGMVKSVTDNAVPSDYVKPMIDVWNEMISMMQGLKTFLDNNHNVYPEWQYCSCCELYKTNNLLGI